MSARTTGRKITIRKLRREREPIARGREYGQEKRMVAFDLLNKTQRLKPDERIVIATDIYRTLVNVHEVRERVRALL